MSQRQSFGSERALVRASAVSQAARQHLQEELRTHVAKAVRALMQSRGIPARRRRELIEVGMRPFERVFNIYLKNAGDRDEEEGHFFAYYIWWMRQEIVAFLQQNQKR